MNQPTVIALGVFDGVHLGHGELLRKSVQMANELSAEPMVLSFDTHPDRLVFGHEVPMINSVEDRLELVSRLYGIKRVELLTFDEIVMHTPWETFFSGIAKRYNAHGIVIGHDFTCGNRGLGRAPVLRDWCERHSIRCYVVPAVYLDGTLISSSHIRALLEAGNISESNRFLGHPYSLSGVVEHGAHIGTTMGAPTANIVYLPHVLIPAFGVYATMVTLPDGSVRPGVTNVGVRPTVSDSMSVTVETHIFDFSGALYGKRLRLDFLDYIRPEMNFPSLKLLEEQICRDKCFAEKIVSAYMRNFTLSERNE